MFFYKKIFFWIFCPKKWLSSAVKKNFIKSTYFFILVGNFTRDAQKYQLWVKICEFDPKLISKLFKSVCDNCFFVLWEKKTKCKNFTIGQIWVIFVKKHVFSLVFFLTPLFFRPETDKLAKKFCRPPEITKIMTKKIYMKL